MVTFHRVPPTQRKEQPLGRIYAQGARDKRSREAGRAPLLLRHNIYTFAKDMYILILTRYLGIAKRHYPLRYRGIR